MTEQRTPQWHLQRKGMITASECYELMKNGSRDMTPEELANHKALNPKSTKKKCDIPFSDATYTYLNKKVTERFMTDKAYLTQCEENYISKAMQWGIDMEPEAISRYSFETGAIVNAVGFIPLKGFEDVAGGSPDGLSFWGYQIEGWDNSGIIEVKCPDSATHLEHFALSSWEDFKSYSPKYYGQCQKNMMCTETTWCDFISYDPRMQFSKQLKIIRVPKDNDYCDTMVNRLEMARKYISDRVDMLNGLESVIIK